MADGIPVYEVFRFAFPNADSSDLNGAVVKAESLEDAVKIMKDYIGINMEEHPDRVKFFSDLPELKREMAAYNGFHPFWFYHMRIEELDSVILCAFNCC